MEAFDVVASGKRHMEDKHAVGIIGLEALGVAEPAKELGFVQNDFIHQFWRCTACDFPTMVT